ncbi:beta family protein [Arenimonas sp. MALMAid1274]|uniref:beta family protein n=1 Tax=Arenimonas sp. MALMAid1274 TaxID=3411630 RepID=UPI003BA34CA3
MGANRYLPVIDLRPAEMFALQELPEKDKEQLRPLIGLRRWSASHELSKSVDRITKAFGTRACFLEMGEEDPVESGQERPVHSQLKDLRSPENGFQNWHDFFLEERHAHFTPGLQTGGSPAEFELQIERLISIGRGLIVRIDKPTSLVVGALCSLIAAKVKLAENVTLVLDFGKKSEQFLLEEGSVKSLVSLARTLCPRADIAVCASSFPDSFTSITSQRIFERVLFERLAKHDRAIIYSDRGSARAERQQGGGGLPAPRIDYAKKDSWSFFRQSSPLATPFLGYQSQSIDLIQSETWEPKLKLWGAQMIEKTAAGDEEGGISSPNRSTAVRINLHLHRQLYFNDEESFLDTDEDWVD